MINYYKKRYVVYLENASGLSSLILVGFEAFKNIVEPFKYFNQKESTQFEAM